MKNSIKIENVRDAFEGFKKRFLVNKKSIFRLDSDEEILTKESIKYLIDNFINNGLGGDAEFIDKIKKQLKKDESSRKNAIEVLAHCVWLWKLVPSKAKIDKTIPSVKKILALDEKLKNINLKSNPFFNEKIKGIAKTGTYYNTNKPFELAFIIKFLDEYLDKKDPIDILIASQGKVSINATGILDENGNFEQKKGSSTKKASIFNALLFFFDPEKYEPIISNEIKKKIVKNLFDRYNCCEVEKFKPEIDWKLHCIKKCIIKKYNLSEEENNTGFFYRDEIKELWDPTILPGKNVIYYGAPGTGKTYEIVELVKRKVKSQINNSTDLRKYFKIVQFHPNYGYEDFIDGVKPVKSKNNNINLELIDGEFKKMCKEALKELKKAKDESREPKKFYFIADEINRAELSRVFGELLLCLEEDKRIRIDDNKNIQGVYIKTQNSNLWEEKNAVLEIDGELYFGVPENIYFLATMNDIDKSIDSFDLALRRRFKWVHKGCNYDVIYNHLLEQGVNDEDILEYVSTDNGRCNLLNKYISEELGLGSSYELGHSYFMKIRVYNKKIPKSSYENLFDLELAPLLKEYLRAEIPDMQQLEKELKYIRKLFVEGKERDKNS